MLHQAEWFVDYFAAFQYKNSNIFVQAIRREIDVRSSIALLCIDRMTPIRFIDMVKDSSSPYSS